MHLAIIVDGNGRWGVSHFGVRTKGHEEGARNVWRLVQGLSEEVDYLTLYGLSVDNIRSRPDKEVQRLYQIFEESFSEGLERAKLGNIRLNYIGNGSLPASLLSLIYTASWATQYNSGLVLSIALSYGSRDEITRAAAKLQAWNEPITRKNLARSLDTYNLPDVDLLVRTGGEQRLSDFLLWQCAYAELFFTDTLFPDFSSGELNKIIKEFQDRQRRYGGLGQP